MAYGPGIDRPLRTLGTFVPFVCFVVKTHDGHGPKRSSDFRLDRAFRDFAKSLQSRPPGRSFANNAVS